MLRAYGPGCKGEAVEPEDGKIPPGATWIDLEKPTQAEEKLVEDCLGLDVPTAEDLSQIEPSSRLYQRGEALYMTLNALHGVEDGKPASAPIGFLLSNDRLVTIRYVTPKPICDFADEAVREPETARDALTVLCGLLDAIVDRLADELERVTADVEKISSHIFVPTLDARRIPATRLTALLTRIGKSHVLLAKIRETETSTSRLIAFLSGSARIRSRKCADTREHLISLAEDTKSLGDHSSFLASHLNFLLDAAVGFISIEQNAAMKLFSWVAIVFLPPTLIGSIYGMNFDHMPELHWSWGYPAALALMVATAVVPLLYLKRRNWI